MGSPYLNPIASSNLSSRTNPGRSATYEAMATALLSEPPRRRFIDGIDNTENNRENLRDMLSKLRKDPMDDDLEKCDGEYFPCEFCGDPYPVEFIMRHQVVILEIFQVSFLYLTIIFYSCHVT